uniref:Uncharacterized protein n=1 Tax=Arundo donax TaxID=35708 RepID=A0A0A9DB62_ARUDO
MDTETVFGTTIYLCTWIARVISFLFHCRDDCICFAHRISTDCQLWLLLKVVWGVFLRCVEHSVVSSVSCTRVAESEGNGDLNMRNESNWMLTTKKGADFFFSRHQGLMDPSLLLHRGIFICSPSYKELCCLILLPL